MLNLTPHEIRIHTEEGVIVIPPSGQVARVITTEAIVPNGLVIDGQLVPVVHRSWEQVEGLPPEGEPCLVSAVVLDRVPGRAGVYAPDTGKTALRDETGLVQAVTRLVAA